MTSTITIPTREQIETKIGPLTEFAQQCHVASVALVKSGLLGQNCRVARGTRWGVGGQHSWVVLGRDCYDPNATAVDLTLWSYTMAPFVAVAEHQQADGYTPHGGYGTIWDYGKPVATSSDYVELTPKTPLSVGARRFLAMLSPLDRYAWNVLAQAPPGGGWHAAEIIAAMDDTDRLRALVPIDRLAMLTDRCPDYLPDPS